MEAILIALCGMNCAICSAYLASKYDIKKYGLRRSLCIGCRPRGKNCTFMQRSCSLIGEGKIQYCFMCDNFPCPRLKRLDKRYRTRYHMSMIENLTYIRDNDMKAFLEKEEKKWRCPECGATICCHDGMCYACNPEKLKNIRLKHQWTDASSH